ncbi:hypothetical protein JCM33774_74750 [Actinophytocola sp. KF-1]
MSTDASRNQARTTQRGEAPPELDACFGIPASRRHPAAPAVGLGSTVALTVGSRWGRWLRRRRPVSAAASTATNAAVEACGGSRKSGSSLAAAKATLSAATLSRGGLRHQPQNGTAAMQQRKPRC